MWADYMRKTGAQTKTWTKQNWNLKLQAFVTRKSGVTYMKFFWICMQSAVLSQENTRNEYWARFAVKKSNQSFWRMNRLLSPSRNVQKNQIVILSKECDVNKQNIKAICKKKKKDMLNDVCELCDIRLSPLQYHNLKRKYTTR